MKRLNNEFFEVLFLFEMEFAESENPDFIIPIIELYNKAINFYKEIGDIRSLDYEKRLSLFLTEENVKQIIKEKNINIKEFLQNKSKDIRKSLSEKKNNIEENRKLIEQLMFNQNKVKNLVKNELDKQDNKFKEKLNQINKSKSLKLQINKKPLKFEENSSNNNSLISMNNENTLDLLKLDKDMIKIFENGKNNNNISLLNSENSFDSINSELSGENILNTNETKETGNILNASFDLLVNNSFNSKKGNKESLINNLIDNYKNIGPKQQKGLFEIENILENSINDINNYYYSILFKKFIDKIKQLSNEKFNHYSEITEIYSEQIKNLEMEMKDLKNNITVNQIKVQIEYLKDEQDDELYNIEEEYNDKINKELNEFKQFSLKNDLTIGLNQENMRLNIYNKICEIITSKK